MTRHDTDPLVDVGALRRLAEAATPGPWEAHTYGHRSVRSAAGAVTRALFAVPVEPEVRDTMHDLTWVQAPGDGPNIALTGNGSKQTENAAYIAAVSPDVVLRLLAVVEAARAVIACGVANRSGDKYRARVAAMDALDDALDALQPDDATEGGPSDE